VNGATSTSSSTFSAAFAASGAIDGDRSGLSWGAGGGWNDATPAVFSDWVGGGFAGSQTISEGDVVTVQDKFWAPVAPTPTTTFSLYGIQDFEVQYWTGSAWQTVPGGAITNNNLVWRKVTFAPLATSRIRVLVSRSVDGWSRITEVEAYSSVT